MSQSTQRVRPGPAQATPAQATPAPTRRALMITPRWTYLPGDAVAPTPADGLTSLPQLLSRLAARMPAGGVCLLDARAAHALGMPHRADAEEFPPDHPALNSARDSGWSVSRFRPFTDFYGASRPRLTLGILPLVDSARIRIVTANPHDTISALTMWHDCMGAPYSGTPGAAGITALRESLSGLAKPPLFRPQVPGPENAEELPYHAESFRGKLPRGCRFMIGYDGQKAYLSAQIMVQVAAFGLRHTGAMPERPPKVAGWFLVKFAPWQGPLSKLLPNPAGYNTPDPNTGGVWVAGPTLDLIDELVTREEHGGYEILDSWTAPILSELSGRLLRPWAERMRDGIFAPRPEDSFAPDFEAFRAALKGAYQESSGMLGNPHSRVYRQDYRAAVIALARSNAWRRMREIGETLKRWPLKIETDCLWYPTQTDDPVAECPTWVDESTGKTRGLILGNRLGTYQVKDDCILPIHRKGAGQ